MAPRLRAGLAGGSHLAEGRPRQLDEAHELDPVQSVHEAQDSLDAPYTSNQTQVRQRYRRVRQSIRCILPTLASRPAFWSRHMLGS